ncbi:carbon monoxide dehydrogenase subunit G (CoxG) [Aeromicrobium marinum DSM 15272]|uniref:Carbon monoxide dehydrogenase subunit G (CoxG) n=1 Tax=Aeromicrobium marinum DSM 15272 TaxID=585531 RepID=E2SFU3_9ACTN|nr:SRPBCC family protein [Aeromicrobium marinum]EFQ81890.1 carbon monoxide dehydrogenase subunit G (CoxG) [Aeromicrobium marinum DSM 15272]
MHVRRSFVVNRPIEQTFDYFADFENTNEWDPGTVETRRTSGDGGLGTTYTNTSQFMGRTTSLTYETIGYDRPTQFVCRGRNKTATATDHLTFTRDGERTRMDYRADFDFRFPINLLAPLLFGRKLQSLADETVEQIQDVLNR